MIMKILIGTRLKHLISIPKKENTWFSIFSVFILMAFNGIYLDFLCIYSLE